MSGGGDDPMDNGEQTGEPGSFEDAFPDDHLEGGVTGTEHDGVPGEASAKAEAAADQEIAKDAGDGPQESRSLDGSKTDEFEDADVKADEADARKFDPAKRAKDIDINKAFPDEESDEDDPEPEAEGAERAAKGDKAAAEEPASDLPEGVDERWAALYKKDADFAAEANRKVADYEGLVEAAGGEEPLRALAARSGELQEIYKWRGQVGNAFSEFRYRIGRGDVGGALDIFKDLGVDQEKVMAYYAERALARAREQDEPGALKQFDDSKGVRKEDLDIFRRARQLEQQNAGFADQELQESGRQWVQVLKEDPYVAEYNKRMGIPPGNLTKAAAAIDRHIQAASGDPRTATAEEQRAAYDSWRAEQKALLGDLKPAADTGAASKPAARAPAAKPASRPAGLNPPTKRGQGGVGSKVQRDAKPKFIGVAEARAAHLKALREERARRLGAVQF